MAPRVLQSSRLILRPPRQEDASTYQQAGRDPAITAMYGTPSGSPTITTEEALHWLENALSLPFGWVIEHEGKAIGHARFHQMNTEEQRTSYAIGMFQSSHTGKGLGTEATRLICQYGFEELHLHRIALRVAAFNQRAIKSYGKVGFREEGRERECFMLNGEWQDDIIMGCLHNEFVS